MNSSRSTQIALWSAALLLGVICGQLVHHATGNSDEVGTRENPGHTTSSDRIRQDSPMSPTSQYLWRETASLRDAKGFREGVTRLHRESRSPLLATALQSFRIRNSSFEDWEPLLAEGEVVRIDILSELGEHLAELDPGRALHLVHYGPRKFDHLDQFYAFRNSVFESITKTKPEVVLEHLQAMRRGGGQRDSSRQFSHRWAKLDPPAAAARFEELVWLRNDKSATPGVAEREYAGVILKSWTEKDPAAAEDYFNNLPPSSKRDAFEAVMAELNTPPAK